MRAEMRTRLALFQAGELSKQELQAQIYELLREAHAGGTAFGRWRAGLLTPMNESDLLAGRLLADEQAFYLIRFLDNIESISEAQAALRMDWYAMRVRGTAGTAFVESSAPDAYFWWILADVEHCPDCPLFASLSPYRQDDLVAIPGDGSTQCLMNCKCYLRREDGVRSFEPFDFPTFEI